MNSLDFYSYYKGRICCTFCTCTSHPVQVYSQQELISILDFIIRYLLHTLQTKLSTTSLRLSLHFTTCSLSTYTIQRVELPFTSVLHTLHGQIQPFVHTAHHNLHFKYIYSSLWISVFHTLSPPAELLIQIFQAISSQDQITCMQQHCPVLKSPVIKSIGFSNNLSCTPTFTENSLYNEITLY